MKSLKVYFIKKEYIEYLSMFDEKIPYNKSQSRPYVGIVYCLEGNHYFAPLSSPKSKHLKISNRAIDVYKIGNGMLGGYKFE